MGSRFIRKETGMDRSQKTDAVAELNRTFNEVGVVVVTRNLGHDRHAIDGPPQQDARRRCEL